jgi:hypothetical protein
MIQSNLSSSINWYRTFNTRVFVGDASYPNTAVRNGMDQRLFQQDTMISEPARPSFLVGFVYGGRQGSGGEGEREGERERERGRLPW